MKKLLVLFLIISNATYSQSKSIDTSKIRQDFETLISNLEKNYVYYTQKDVDLSCLKTYYCNRIKTLKNETDVLLFFEYLLDEFYDTHLHLNSSIKSSYRLYSPIFVTNVGTKTEISSVWKDQIESGININLCKAEILTFNGFEFNQLIDSFPTHCQNKNNLEVRTWISNKILSGRYNEPRIITLKTAVGTIETLDIDKIKIRKDTTLLTYKIVENIGIIRLNNSLGETKSKREFKKILKKLKNTDGIILDLRNTVDGGITNVGNPIARHFTNKKQIFQKYKNSYVEFVDHIKPQQPKYTKPLVVLVGRWTGSMGEGLASGFDGTGIGTLVGTEMQKLAGATKGYKFNYSPFGYQASYIDVLHINGTPRQKLVPKHIIECTNGKEDEFIKEAIELLKRKD